MGLSDGAGRALARLALLGTALLGLVLLGQALLVPAKALVAQHLLDRAFRASFASGKPIRAWPWADAVPLARLRVERLGVSAIVLSGGSGEAMAFGPTLLPGGGQPGESGTAVLAAHRDTHFHFLGDLRPGDRIEVETTTGRTIRYRVRSGRIVRRDRFAIDRHGTVPTLVLTTCWPLDGDVPGPWRYAVTAVAEEPSSATAR